MSGNYYRNDTEARAALDNFAAGRKPVAFEAQCESCGEAFNPNGDELVKWAERDGERVALFEHYARHGPDESGEYDTECGGYGPLVGCWF